MLKHTKVIVAKGLNDLRYEEEREFHRMLLQHPVGILQQLRMIVVSAFEERDGNDRSNGSPQEQILSEHVSGA